MALSDYDTLAFNNDCESCIGIFKHPCGSELEIYKSRLYVRSPIYKDDQSDFTKNIIASINSGDINIAKFDIISKRGTTQNSIFVYAEYFEDSKVIRFCGIGCYGHIDTTPIYVEKLGLDKNQDWYEIFCGGKDEGTELWCSEDTKRVKVPKDIIIKDTWVGVSEDLLKEFYSFLDSLIEDYDEEYIKKIKEIKNPIRYNQGDAFFSATLDIELPSTEIGKCEKSIFSQILEGMK